MKKLIYFLLLSPLWGAGGLLFAQSKEFDMTTTQALVDQNKSHYGDNTTAKTSQAGISVLQTANTSLQSQITTQCNSLDKQLTSVFSVLGDVQMLTDVLNAISQIVNYQSQSAKIVAQNVWLSAWYVPQQEKILSDAEDFYGLIALIVVQIGDINKIDEQQRKMIFYGIRDEENKLVQKNVDLLNMMNALIQAYKQLTTLPTQFANNNAQIVNNIMANIKL